MKVEIFNVNHGQCAVVTAPNGRRIMLDCGDRIDGDRWWSPTMHYMGQHFDVLAALNLDEDHLSDFWLVQKYLKIDWILTNPTVGPDDLLSLKRDGMRKGVSAFHDWMRSPYKGVTAPLPDFGEVAIRWYCNPFVPGLTNETNNLSLVIFIEYAGTRIAFTGDMEASGWRELLIRHPRLKWELAGTSIFVASHHGRVSGCCEEIFELFRPEIVVISDDSLQFDTQETTDWYRQRCLGASLVVDPSQCRYVVTTRKDGDVRIIVNPDGTWLLTPVTVQDWSLSPIPQTPNFWEALKPTLGF